MSQFHGIIGIGLWLWPQHRKGGRRPPGRGCRGPAGCRLQRRLRPWFPCLGDPRPLHRGSPRTRGEPLSTGDTEASLGRPSRLRFHAPAQASATWRPRETHAAAVAGRLVRRTLCWPAESPGGTAPQTGVSRPALIRPAQRVTRWRAPDAPHCVGASRRRPRCASGRAARSALRGRAPPDLNSRIAGFLRGVYPPRRKIPKKTEVNRSLRRRQESPVVCSG